MQIIHHRKAVLDQLWMYYLQQCRYVGTLCYVLHGKGEKVVNDHIAFHTVGDPKVGADQLARSWIGQGYEPADHFEEPTLTVRSYRHADPGLPKLLIRELNLDTLHGRSRDILGRLLAYLPEWPGWRLLHRDRAILKVLREKSYGGIKVYLGELEVTNQELLARLGRVEVEPAPETASGDGQPPKDAPDAQEQQVTDEFWGPHTGLKRPHERPKTAPMTNRPADKPPRPKTLPMPPKDDEGLYLMKSIECSVCGTKNTIESKLKGNVEFVCRGCSKRSFTDIS